MYSFSAGSPHTFGCETNVALSGARRIDQVGPGVGYYLQEGKPLSFVPRFNGLGCPAIMQRSGMLGLGADEPAAAGGGWADVIAATVGGLATIYSLSTQQKLLTQQQHQAARDAAAAAQQAQTQQMYRASGSITPGLSQQAPVGGGGMGSTLLVLGGVAVAGIAAFALLRRRR